MMIEPQFVWGTSRLWDPPSPRSEETPVIFSLPYVAQAGETEVGMGTIGFVGFIHFLHLKPLKLLEHLWPNNCQHGLGQFLLRWFVETRHDPKFWAQWLEIVEWIKASGFQPQTQERMMNDPHWMLKIHHNQSTSNCLHVVRITGDAVWSMVLVLRHTITIPSRYCSFQVYIHQYSPIFHDICGPAVMVWGPPNGNPFGRRHLCALCSWRTSFRALKTSWWRWGNTFSIQEGGKG